MGVTDRNDQSGFAASPRVREDAIGYLSPMVARAQNFEDVILRRVLQDIACGFYIDIGAAHPLQDSVTAWFYEAGWRGINIEPNPEYFVELERTRERDINLSCVVGAGNGTRLFTVLQGTGLSSGVPGSIESAGYVGSARPRVILVPEVTLDHVFSLAQDTVIDFLKIDAEGMESEILGSCAFARHRPRVIVVEATRPNTQIPTHQEWEPNLLAKDYDFALFDGLNRFYVRREDSWRQPIFAVPPCVFDNFLVPTLVASRRDAEAVLGQCEAVRDAAEQALQQTAARASTLEAALAQSEAARSTAAARLATLEATLAQSESARDAAVARVANLEVAVAQSEYARSTALESATAGEQALKQAAAQVASLEATLSRSRAEAAAWEEARLWKLPNMALHPILRFAPVRALRRKMLLRTARLAAKRQEWTLAARKLSLVLAERDDTPHIWVEYGHALKEAGARREAARVYRKVLMLMPDHHDVGHHLSVLLETTRQENTSDAAIPSIGDASGSRKRPGEAKGPIQEGVALLEENPARQQELILRDLGFARPLASH